MFQIEKKNKCFVFYDVLVHSANHERFPGNTKRAFKWSNLVRKARGCRVTLSAYFGQAPFSPKEKKKNTIITQHAVTGVHNLLCVKAAAVTTL